MNHKIESINKCLEDLSRYFLTADEEQYTQKPNKDRWSGKEILGHLIDSAIANIRRFTEIQFVSKPYQIRGYKQNELVIANNYQEANIQELLNLLISINKRIIALIGEMTDEQLEYEIEIDGKIENLRFLIADYGSHMEHHTNQIIG